MTSPVLVDDTEEFLDMTHSVSSAWYADFFTELPNEFWRRAVPPEATEADVDFIEARLHLAPGARILDVPCGSGRHTLALAARGHRVTGVDLSQEAIAFARRAAAQAGSAAEFFHADMRDLPDGPFDAAVCMGNSFGYLDLAGTRAFVAGLAGAVRPGGGLLIDFSAAAESILQNHDGKPRAMEAGDIQVVATGEYQVAASRLVSTYRFTRGSQELTSVALHHVYTCGHLTEILGDAGFGVVEMYAGTGGEEFTLGAPRLLLAAVRR